MNEKYYKIFDALEFAAQKHQGQKRKGTMGIPYINHPVEVTTMLTREMGDIDEKLIISSLLHDVLEDTDTSPEELSARFGNHVLEIVEEVSDDMSLPSAIRKEFQVENAGNLSYPARCIRIADKACNIRDILYTRIKWSRRRKVDYIIWAMRVVDRVRGTHEQLEEAFDRIVDEASEKLSHRFR